MSVLFIHYIPCNENTESWVHAQTIHFGGSMSYLIRCTKYDSKLPFSSLKYFFVFWNYIDVYMLDFMKFWMQSRVKHLQILLYECKLFFIEVGVIVQKRQILTITFYWAIFDKDLLIWKSSRCGVLQYLLQVN